MVLLYKQELNGIRLIISSSCDTFVEAGQTNKTSSLLFPEVFLDQGHDIEANQVLVWLYVNHFGLHLSQDVDALFVIHAPYNSKSERDRRINAKWIVISCATHLVQLVVVSLERRHRPQHPVLKVDLFG